MMTIIIQSKIYIPVEIMGYFCNIINYHARLLHKTMDIYNYLPGPNQLDTEDLLHLAGEIFRIVEHLRRWHE